MSALGTLLLLYKTGRLDEEKVKRNGTMIFFALIFDIIYFLAMITSGALAAQGKIFAASKKEAMISFFTLAATHFATNAIVLQRIVKDECNEKKRYRERHMFSHKDIYLNASSAFDNLKHK